MLPVSKPLRAAVAALALATRTAPFARFGCVLHRSHHPEPSTSELHHVFPVYLQARVWPTVDPARPATAKDPERIPVCADGHNDIHGGINAILASGPLPKGVGKAEREYAQMAVDRYRAAGGV